MSSAVIDRLLNVDAAAKVGRTAETTVRVVDPVTDPRWDSFVLAHPRATAYHLAAWSQILREAYRFHPVSLVLEDSDGRLQGVLPAAYKSGPISGRRITSLPVVGQGGPLAATHSMEAALVAAACRLADERRAILRLHSRRDYGEVVPAVSATLQAPSWVLVLPGDADELRSRWKQQGNVARNLRKAEAAALTVREGHSKEDLKAFYAVYLRTMKKHRAVPHSYRFFAMSQRLLTVSGAFQLVLVEKEGRVLAGSVGYVFRDVLDALFVAVDDRYLELRPSYALHWEIIRGSIARRLRQVNLGRTRAGGSQAAFKAQWGAEPLSEFEYVYPRGPAPGLRAQHALTIWRGPLAEAVWARTPIPITRVAGTVLYRYL